MAQEVGGRGLMMMVMMVMMVMTVTMAALEVMMVTLRMIAGQDIVGRGGGGTGVGCWPDYREALRLRLRSTYPCNAMHCIYTMHCGALRSIFTLPMHCIGLE